jgi:hypothetical protein
MCMKLQFIIRLHVHEIAIHVPHGIGKFKLYNLVLHYLNISASITFVGRGCWGCCVGPEMGSKEK